MDKDNFIKSCVEKCVVYDKENDMIIDYVHELNQNYNKIGEIRRKHETFIKGIGKKGDKNCESINNDNSVNNLIVIQKNFDEMKIECEKKYNEYKFCKYENEVIIINILKNSTDKLLKKYVLAIKDINHIEKLIKNRSIDNDIIEKKLILLVKKLKKFIDEFNNVIEEEIGKIKIGPGYPLDTRNWIIMANHTHNNKYDYSHVIYIKSILKVNIICPNHGLFIQVAQYHLAGSECPECNMAIRKQKSLDLHSFAFHEKSKYWSQKNKLNPNEVTGWSEEKYLFDCDCGCGHEFWATPNGVQSGYWCPYRGNKILCDDDNCDFCFNKSFKSHPKHIHWSNKNNCTPRQVFKVSANKYFFDCDNCNHLLELRPADITNNNWCPYCCVPPQKLCDDCDKNCQDCYNKSFATHPKSEYWSKKNIINPYMCFKNKHTKYLFDCPDCNTEYCATLNSVSGGHWCDCTVNKTETKLYDYLKITYNNSVIEKQKKVDWCRNKQFLPFDFCLEQYKVIVEIDGNQHFKQISSWRSPEETQKVDKFKMIQARDNGYSIIRILQTDVWSDKNNWKENLHEAIIKVKENIGNPIIIYIGELYKTHYFTIG
jgi:very-short-patch-repair endonuclease